MGHIFTRMTTIWLEQQTQNRSKSTVNKRKHVEYEYVSNKKRNTIRKNDSDDDERLVLSPRISPIITKSSNSMNRSLLSMTFFKCQLCHRYLKNKDIYMNHMTICAIQSQASIKIVRAIKDKDELSI